MKKILFISIFLFPFLSFSQSHSWNGKGIASNAKVRCLNIFVNIIYDVHPDYNNPFLNSTYWPPVSDPTLEGINNTAIPTYLLDWMDTVYISGQLHGYCTRLYGESSFDSLQVTGDFVVVNLRESTVRAVTNVDTLTCNKIVIAALDLISVSGLQAIFGHNSISDYDYNHDGLIDFMNVLIRNINKQHADINPGSGYGKPLWHHLNIGGAFYYAKAGTRQCVGDGDFYANPTNIVTHEISHSLFGGNEFHTSGGNHRYVDGTVMAFLNLQAGYGLMGAAHSGLVCCNGYERWRMHWKHPQSVDYISARDITNTQSVASDITKELGNRNFILRDFVTYGDAVRIKLPYKDSVTSSNQYIWLENHQVGKNNKLDFLQYSNFDRYDCRPQGAAGIYAYYQIGRDVLVDTAGDVWDEYHRDNLKIIPAEGFYDYELFDSSNYVNCVANVENTYAMRRGILNPLCGGQDQEFHLFPRDNDTVLYTTREIEPFLIIINGYEDKSLPFLGDNRDAFNTHTKINMGTNPSTNNAKTYHSTNINPDTVIKAQVTEKNVQTTYLTGLSIEMTPIQGTGNIQVSVRWDDYDITNDTRWTGKIALKETAILTAEKTIILAQNRTVAQPKRDLETGLFAGRTRWTCENGSFFRQDSASALILTENSSIIFESGSHYELSKDARVEVHSGCSLTVQPGAKVQLKGTVEVDSGGVLILYDTARMGTFARLIVRPGGKLVIDGGTLTSACDGEMWQGIEVVGDRTKLQTPQYQGVVELRNGATIENAHCAIHTGLQGNAAYATAGGIVRADSAFFINNRRAVAFISYLSPALGDNVSYFRNTEFTVNNNNLFAANACDFIDHVTLWQVKGVEFKGCTFKNLTSAQSDRRHAIYAEDAGFSLLTYCNDYTPANQPDCECPENYASLCSFTGFTTAVELVTTDSDPYAVTVDEAQFSNNTTGLRVNGNNYVTVTRCTFNLQSAPGMSLINTGLVLDHCSGYKVEGNTFVRSSANQILNSIGISVIHSDSANNSLYRNHFEKLNYGILVSGTNGNLSGGLQMTCGTFSQNNYDMYISDRYTFISPIQGSLQISAGNTFSGTQNYNIQNNASHGILYCYTGKPASGNPYYPNLTSGNVFLQVSALGNPCLSTLCNAIPDPGPVTAFAAQISAYTAAQADYNDNQDSNNSPNLPNSPTISLTQLAGMRQSLTDTYYAAVRALMSDSLLDLAALEQWHAAAQPIADPYSLTETRFMEGYAETFAENTEDVEMANYAEFHAMKLALRGQNDNAGGENDNMADQDNNNLLNLPNSPTLLPTINWYALTPVQIAQLQTIAERNTGRASVMAKGVLCFFFDICYEDEDVVSETDSSAETRAKRTAVGIADDAGTHANEDVHVEAGAHANEGAHVGTPLRIWPNPTDDLLFVELRGAGIADVALYDLQGRVVTGIYTGMPQQTAIATLNVKTVPAGVYVLRVTDAEGREYQGKVVRK